ncbi:DNA glycosylase [Truncatella angustata]|uniref:DNA glycosylase n=1 Tax=Truncatella angustata TaxID=152316 RepID=A0A9P8RJI2_9PEZI|nr:DNA glycosylase [Truncatella angustata]KAH6647007.1 DNA glycosylase [Truncatella angustata]
MCDTDAPKPATRYSLRNRKAITTPVAHGTSVQEDAAPIIAQDTESNLKITGSRNELDGAPPKKRQRRSKKAAAEDGNSQTKETGIATKPKRKARRTKDNPYGMMPGETPYPDWVAPTAEECQEVYDILAEIHDDVKALPPEKIPAPSLDVAGCGEVPSVLDGLIRTVLSGSTTFESADKMLKALVARFGVLEVGVGKGSVNWNNIRVAEHDDVYAQLKDGGLGKIKTKHIQGILSMVHDENMESRAAYLVETESGVHADIAGASTKTEGQKKLEILKADQDMLSLDHMHDMETQEAMKHFVRYPGVGVKTAACVTLFSLQRPCFAVDTHVFRLSKWLAWVPQKTNEDDTFSHLEFRCPDKLKYGLHQLFIRHGKTCHRCNDKSFLGTDAWNASRCPLEQLVNRYTKRVAKLKEIEAENKKKGKDKVTAKGKRLQQGAGQNTGLTKIAKDEDDATDSELSELDEADVDM